MATRCLFAADLDLATGKQVCPCVQTPGQSPRGLFAFHVVAVTRLFFSLYCVVYSENTTKRYKTLLLALPFFTFGSFVFFSTRNNNQIGKLHLVVTRTLHFSLHATIHGKLHAFFFSLPSALLILHFCIHKHLFNSALITSPPNQTRKTITWAHSRLL
uniref:(northern house mosquito) hypothetical protein n=1 Tax=Culex pipiens TaxID=7175 RepID=A0A8D8BYS4_CULPI